MEFCILELGQVPSFALPDNFEPLDQIYSKGIFPVENRTNSPKTTVKRFSAIIFEHFEDLKNLQILNILKEKLVTTCFLGFFILKLYKAFQIVLCK